MRNINFEEQHHPMSTNWSEHRVKFNIQHNS